MTLNTCSFESNVYQYMESIKFVVVNSILWFVSAIKSEATFDTPRK